MFRPMAAAMLTPATEARPPRAEAPGADQRHQGSGQTLRDERPIADAGARQHDGDNEAGDLASGVDGNRSREAHLTAKQCPVLDAEPAQQKSETEPAGDAGELGLAVEFRQQRRGDEEGGRDDGAGRRVYPEQHRDLGMRDIRLTDRGGGQSQLLYQVQDGVERCCHGDQAEGRRRQKPGKNGDGRYLQGELQCLGADGDGSAANRAPTQTGEQMVGAQLRGGIRHAGDRACTSAGGVRRTTGRSFRGRGGATSAAANP
jgi:hypothetical protein